MENNFFIMLQREAIKHVKRGGNKMKTIGDKLLKQFLVAAKFGVLVLGMMAVLCIPHIVLAAHGQAHSNNLRAFSHSMGYLAEKDTKANENAANTTKETDHETHIIIASDKKAELPCPRKTDADDKR